MFWSYLDRIYAPQDYGLLYLGIIFQSLFSYATALLVAALSQRSEVIEKSISVLSYLSLPLSGAFIFESWLPLKARNILLWSPSVNNIEMIRGGQFGQIIHPYYDIIYDAYATSIMLIIGISLPVCNAIGQARAHIPSFADRTSRGDWLGCPVGFLFSDGPFHPPFPTR